MKHLFMIMAFGVTMSAHAAAPSVYKYLIEGLPSTGATCAEEAERLAGDFKTATGIALATGRCLHDGGADFDIQIEYSADKRVEPISTIEFVVGVASSNQGTYARRDLCEAELPMQTDMFTKQTGLEPLVAFCYHDSNEPRNGWALRIDAFGKPPSRPRIASLELFGYVRGDLEAFDARLRAYAKSKLPNFSSATIRNFAADHAIRVMYYSPKVLPVRSERLGEYRHAADCQHAQALAAAKIDPPLYCVDDPLLQRNTLELFQVKTGAHFDLVKYPKTFGSYAECEAGADDAMADVEKSVGSHPVTAACHDASGGAALTVIVTASREVRSPR